MCLALQQKRTGDGKSARMDVGATRKAVADGDAGVCVLAVIAGEPVGGVAELALTGMVPPNRNAAPRGCSSALPLAFGTLTALASLPAITRRPQIKFGMTHVDVFTDHFSPLRVENDR